MLLRSRTWLRAIAEDYARHAGVYDPMAAAQAAQTALDLLRLAPWHMRLLVGGAECVASLWCTVHRFMDDKASLAQEMVRFETMPGGRALLRLYRSLVAVSWFEQPIVLAAYGIGESMEARQERFRQTRGAA